MPAGSATPKPATSSASQTCAAKRPGPLSESQALATVCRLPAMSAALAYFDGYRSARLPANLLQAQRDYFGAHTYERVDQPRGKFFHTNWTGKGGNVSAGTYTV